MISRSVQSFIVASFFLASLVIALCTGNALAGNITYDNNSFTGTSTNLTILGQTLLPYTDPDGRVVSIVSGPVAFRTVNFGGVVIVHHDYDPPPVSLDFQISPAARQILGSKRFLICLTPTRLLNLLHLTMATPTQGRCNSPKPSRSTTLMTPIHSRQR